MNTATHHAAPWRRKAVLTASGCLLATNLLTGCSTPALNTARSEYYSGRARQSEQALSTADIPDRDRVLYLMERGTVRQSLGEYDKSSKDFIEASDRIEELQTYSVSKGGASMVVNDNVQDYRGAPFERTLVHSLNALNHFATGNWDDAAVEARRILKTLAPETLGNYPDDSFSRYVAGFAFEMIDDPSNAALQYKKASELAVGVDINPDNGKLKITPSTNMLPNQVATAEAPPPDPALTHELVCFVLSGRSPSGDELLNGYTHYSLPQFAEIWVQGRILGRSYTLSDATSLALKTQQIEAAIKAAKTLARVAIKEGIASAVEHNSNDGYGFLVRLVLLGLMEQPDTRRWETLPRWLQVARVPCPPDLTDFEVVFKSSSGSVIRKIQVSRPLMRRRNTYVSFCRDLVIYP